MPRHLIIMRRSDLFDVIGLCQGVEFARIGSLWMDVLATDEDIATLRAESVPFHFTAP